MANNCYCRLELKNLDAGLRGELEKYGLDFDRVLPVDPQENQLERFRACRETWGTDWQASEGEKRRMGRELCDEGATAFVTPWSPPLEVVLQLSVMHPGAMLCLSYYEPMGGDLGLQICCAGRQVFQHEACMGDGWEAFLVFVMGYSTGNAICRVHG